MSKLTKLLLTSLTLLVISACGGGGIETGPDVSTPSNLRIVSTGVTTIGLDWDYTGPVDVTTGFNVYRNGLKVKHTAGTSYTDYNLTPEIYYCYTVTAYNFWGDSGHSNKVCTTTLADTESPIAPDNFSADNTYNNEAALAWNKSLDNTGVIGYKVYRNNQYLMTVTDTSATDYGLSDNTDYCYKVRAYDLSGNESDPSNEACVDTSWKIEDINANDDVTGIIDIAVDTNNKAHIIYVDELTLELRYTTNATGTWTTETLDALNYYLTSYASIALDSHNNAHISYFDSTDTDLKYASNQTGDWVTDILVDSYVSITGRFNSIAIDSQNYVHISYLGEGGVRYANNTSGPWAIETVDVNGTGATSIDIDSQDNVHIVYLSNISDSLLYAKKVADIWTPETLVNYYYYSGLDMDIDPNDNIHICNADYITNKTGQWIISDVGEYLSLSSCSIAAESENDIHISHSVIYRRVVYEPYYIPYSNRDIRYTKLEDNKWSTYTLDDVTPWSSNSIALGTNGSAHVVFYSLYDLGLKYVTNQQ